MKKLLVVLAFALALVVSPAANAVSVINCDKAGVSASDCNIVKSDDLNYQSGSNRIWSVVSIVLGILGGVAVIMIVIGGIKYATSQGEPGQVKAAKNTIMYAVIGLVVAMFASGIVLLVQSYFQK